MGHVGSPPGPRASPESEANRGSWRRTPHPMPSQLVRWPSEVENRRDARCRHARMGYPNNEVKGVVLRVHILGPEGVSHVRVGPRCSDRIDSGVYVTASASG